jgi:hypothetical protein
VRAVSRPPVQDRAAYEAALVDLRAQLAALPPEAPVRLGKRTSNLFRTRTAPVRGSTSAPSAACWRSTPSRARPTSSG